MPGTAAAAEPAPDPAEDFISLADIAGPDAEPEQGSLKKKRRIKKKGKKTSQDGVSKAKQERRQEKKAAKRRAEKASGLGGTNTAREDESLNMTDKPLEIEEDDSDSDAGSRAARSRSDSADRGDDDDKDTLVQRAQAAVAGREELGLDDTSDEEGGLQINLESDDEAMEDADAPKSPVAAQGATQDDERRGHNSPMNRDHTVIPRQQAVGRDDVLLHPNEAFWQRLYYQGYRPPPFEHEEERPMFAHITTNINGKRLWIEEELREPISEARRVCTVCREVGHGADNCMKLWCDICGAFDEHFPAACPKKPLSPPPDDKDAKVQEVFTYKWNRIRPEHCKSTPLKSLSTFCYRCASNTHYGDDCPYSRRSVEPGSFSNQNIRGLFASDAWSDEYDARLEFVNGEPRDPITYDRAASNSGPKFDPFADYVFANPRRGLAPAKPQGVKDWFDGPRGRDQRPRGSVRGRGGSSGSSYRGRGGYALLPRRDRSPAPLPARRDWGPPPGPGRGGRAGSGGRSGDSYRPMPSAAKDSWNRLLR